MQVVAGADPVVAISDPQRLALDQQHRRQPVSELNLVEVGGDFGVLRAEQSQVGGPQDVFGGVVFQRPLLAQGPGHLGGRLRPHQER